MLFFKRIKNSQAQHAIEYTILMILIMAGIIIAGPYVVRSWNANLKGWEDSASDSLQDPFLNASSGGIPPYGTCDHPGTWTDVGCGLGTFDPCTGLTFSCGPQELLQEWPFDPSGCQCTSRPPLPPAPITEYLNCDINDANHCCTAWSPFPPTAADCGANASPPCPDTLYRRNHTCDTGYVETECVFDPICVFSCLVPPNPTVGPPNYAPAICPSDNLGLISSIPYTLVLNGMCTPGTKCEWECALGRFLFGSGPGAYCGPCTTIGFSTNGCPAGQINTTGCFPGNAQSCCYLP